MKPESFRILIADDNPAIHAAYRSIFSSAGQEEQTFPGAQKFAPELATPQIHHTFAFELTSVMQGEEAITAAAQAKAEAAPFALAILDVRMPPGIDGVQTARRLLADHPGMQIVLCTAYSDYAWADLAAALPEKDSVLLLKKPFDAIEVLQLAHSLCRKWRLAFDYAALVRQLESRVSERTAQLALANAQLELALDAAQAANRAKHAFLRCVSHELNTPLNGIQGAAYVVGESTDELARQMGRIIIDSGERLNHLFKRILLFLNLEADLNGKVYAINPAASLAKTIEAHQTVALAKGLSLTSRVNTPAHLNAQGPAEWLEAALDNLVDNALKFTASGSVDVRLTYDSGPSRLILEVTDTGPGLDPARLNERTALFSPGDDSLTRKNEGIGIGLALVTRITRLLGGTLEARPGIPTGSVLRLIIPCTPTTT